MADRSSRSRIACHTVARAAIRASLPGQRPHADAVSPVGVTLTVVSRICLRVGFVGVGVVVLR